MTKAQKEAKAAVTKWARKRGWQVVSVSHLHPRSYVLARPAPQCLVVARPWMDSEPQVRESDRRFKAAVTIHEFDDALNACDWCITAYVSTPTSGRTVAVSIPAK